MKILFVTTCYAPNEVGGAEINVRMIAERLAAQGEAPAVVSIAPDGIARSAELNGVRCHYLSLFNLYWPHTAAARPALWRRMIWHVIDAYNPVMAARLARVIEQEKPDLINTHNLQGFSVAAWRAAARRGIPVVQTVQDYYLGCCNSVMYRNGRNCARQCADCRLLGTPRRMLSHIPAAVTSLSRRTLARLEAAGLFRSEAEKIVIRGSNGATPHVRPRRDRGAGEDIRLGFLGRLEQLKGIELLLGAMRRVAAGNVSLLVAGRAKPDYMERLRQTYAAPNVRFLGFAQPAEFFDSIDALIVPSLWEEPLGRVIHEAYGFGVPVIAAAIGGMREIVEDDVTGYLFPVGDEAALAALVERIAAAGLPATRFFDACRARSLDFDSAAICDQYLAVFRRALRAGRGAREGRGAGPG